MEYTFLRGDRVKPDPLHEDYIGYQYQHQNNNGIITQNYNGQPGEWVQVKWDNGHNNSYNPAMLILIDDKPQVTSTWDDVERLKNDPKAIEERRKKVESMFELPFLPGQRVCLNPECDRYKQLSRYAENGVGYIVNISADDRNLKDWSNISDKRNINVRVKFDNGWSSGVRHRELLPIDAPSKVVTRYLFQNYDTIYDVEGSEQKHLDNIIIREGARISEIITYDNEWRAMIIQAIAESTTTQTTVSEPKKRAVKRDISVLDTLTTAPIAPDIWTGFITPTA